MGITLQTLALVTQPGYRLPHNITIVCRCQPVHIRDLFLNGKTTDDCAIVIVDPAFQRNRVYLAATDLFDILNGVYRTHALRVNRPQVHRNKPEIRIKPSNNTLINVTTPLQCRQLCHAKFSRLR